MRILLQTIQDFFSKLIYSISQAKLITISIPLAGLLTFYFFEDDWLQKQFPNVVPGLPGWAPQKTLAGVFTFFFGLLLVRWGRYIERYWGKFHRRHFIDLFGEKLESSDHLVQIPSFVPGVDNVRLIPNDVELTFIHSCDIHRVLASADVQAATYIIEAIAPYTAKGPQLVFLENTKHPYFEQDEFPLFAFGLQTNPSAPKFLERFNNADRIEVLYRRKKDIPEAAPDPYRKLAKVEALAKIHISVENQAAIANIKEANGNVLTFKSISDETSGSSEVEWNLGIAAVLRDKTDHEHRKILCAGVGPGGTSGSSWFLSEAKNWASLAAGFGKTLEGTKETPDMVVSFTLTRLSARDAKKGTKMEPGDIAKMKANDKATREILRVACYGVYKDQ